MVRFARARSLPDDRSAPIYLISLSFSRRQALCIYSTAKIFIAASYIRTDPKGINSIIPPRRHIWIFGHIIWKMCRAAFKIFSYIQRRRRLLYTRLSGPRQRRVAATKGKSDESPEASLDGVLAESPARARAEKSTRMRSLSRGMCVYFSCAPSLPPLPTI